MIGLIFGDTNFPIEILKKIKKRRLNYLIIDLSKSKKFKKDINSHSISIGQFGKIIKILKDNNSKVIVGAADTFRAAAIEQLDNWCQKNSIDIEKSDPGTDPAAVAFKTLEKAKQKFSLAIKRK